MMLPCEPIVLVVKKKAMCINEKIKTRLGKVYHLSTKCQCFCTHYKKTKIQSISRRINLKMYIMLQVLSIPFQLNFGSLEES